MLKVPERLFISEADGRLASPCWPSPSLPLFIEQPRDTLNDTGRGTVGTGGGGAKVRIEWCLLSEPCLEAGVFWTAIMSPSHFL